MMNVFSKERKEKPQRYLSGYHSLQYTTYYSVGRVESRVERVTCDPLYRLTNTR